MEFYVKGVCRDYNDWIGSLAVDSVGFVSDFFQETKRVRID